MALNRLFLSLSNNTAAAGLVSLLERIDKRIDVRSPQVLRVLTYHRIADPDKTPHLYPRVTVKPEAFERQMRFISSHYHVVSMAEVLHAANSGAPLPGQAVLITFDDAYRDFAENALPVLQRYQLPVTLFVPTAFPDHPELAFWWDKLYAAIQCARNLELIQTPVGRLPVGSEAQRKQTFSRVRDYVKSTPHQAAMDWVNRFCEELEAPSLAGDILTWEALRKLSGSGVTLGPHTRTHPMMNQISSADIRAEAAGSWQDLRNHTGDTLPIFAYPSGGYNQAVLKILAEEGFQLAFTTQRGLNDFQQSDWLQLKRINVGPKTSLPLLRAQLLSWTRFIRRSFSRTDQTIYE